MTEHAIAQTVQPSAAQAGIVTIDIPAQPLSRALIRFSQQTRVEVFIDSSVASGKNSAAIKGSLPPQEALQRLLAGTGLVYRFTNSNTVTIQRSDAQASVASAPADAILLDELHVSGGKVRPEDRPYQTPGSTNYISREQIETYPGTSPADMLKNAPGVLSGESRASGGLDVNIRGMQGMGRVPVTVDGAQNSQMAYRGYQGISNRTYVDPDFIGGINIEKGPGSGAAGAGAIGGLVAMRTISADDIVGTGKNFGSKFKLEGGTNTSAPWDKKDKAILAQNSTPTHSMVDRGTGVDRPGLFEMNSGSASAIVATKSDAFDLVAGFSRRKSGNYHAGTTGGSQPQQEACGPAGRTDCRYDWYRLGLTAYLPGEEVLNTSQDAYSALLKGTFRFLDDHKLDLGYSHYDSIYGETYPQGIWNNTGLTTQSPLSKTTVKTFTANYNWKPATDLVDFTWNAWRTDLKDDTNSFGATSRKFGVMLGTDVSNTSRFDTAFGDLSFKYGGAVLSERTGPRDEYSRTGIAAAREGERKETSVFANGKWGPVDWLSLDAGTRYHRYEARNTRPLTTEQPKEASALDYSTGIMVTPVKPLQLFTTYKVGSRLPSLFETATAFLTTIDPNLKPERMKSLEIGANVNLFNLAADGDALKVKFAYFNNNIDDYINRQWLRVCAYFDPSGSCYSWGYTNVMNISNIDKAKFQGIELNSRYDYGSFSAELNGTYYTDVQFCRTAATCINSSLAADYATNHIPPKYTASLTLSKTFLDTFTLSGRVTHVGPRSAKAEPTQAGASPFIAPIIWMPYTIFDLSARAKLTSEIDMQFSVENLTDVYYVDPLNLAMIPSPGRIMRLGVTGHFSDKADGVFAGADVAGFRMRTRDSLTHDWTGLYAGLHGGAFDSGAVAADHVRHIVGGIPPGTDKPVGDVDGRMGGGQVGFNYQFANNMVAGVEAEYSYARGALNSPVDSRGRGDWVGVDYNSIASVRLRAGYASGQALFYVTGGRVAIDALSASKTDSGIVSDRQVQRGWAAGGGVEYALSSNWSMKGEYLFMATDGAKYRFARDIGFGLTETLSWEATSRISQLRAGVNYRF